MVGTSKLTADYENIYAYSWVRRNGTAWFADIKLEIGNKATDWTPAPEDIDNKFTNYPTTTQMNSAITQKANEITNTVSKTYTSKADFNNLSIGGTNLLKNSDFIRGKESWSFDKYSSIDTTRTFNGHDSAKIIVSGSESYGFRGISQTIDKPFNSGDTFTASLWYYVSSTSGFDDDFAFDIDIKKSGNTNFSTVSGAICTIPYANLVTGKWTRAYFTITLSEDCEAIRFNCYLKKNGLIRVADLQVEEGSKLTAWSPSPEDFNGDLDIIRTDVSSVTQTASSLTTEVSKKLDSADLSSRIQQSATDIKIGFNGINNYISISDSMGIRVNHTDGSYSRINEDGFLYYNSGTERRYHCLYASGTIQLTGSGSNEKFTITLPSSFSKVSASDIILMLSMDGPRLWASDGVYYTEFFSVSNWIDVGWKWSGSYWYTDEISAHYRAYNTNTKQSEYLKAYITYIALA